MPIVPLEPITGRRPEGVAPIPVVVTAETAAETKRWRVLLASKELRVLRDSDIPDQPTAPVISVHVEHHDVWLSWIQPTDDPVALRQRLMERWQNGELWLDQHGRMEHHVERHRAWGRMLHGLAELGYSMVDKPGNIRWLQFTTRDEHIDWRLKADIIADLVWRESAGAGI